MGEPARQLPALPQDDGDPAGFPAVLRARAEFIVSWTGNASEAEILRRVAGELEDRVSAWEDALLSLTEAEAESPYTADWIGRLVKQGKIPNRGRRNAPRIRRGDLVAIIFGRPRPARLELASDSSPAGSREHRDEAIRSRLKGGD